MSDGKYALELRDVRQSFGKTEIIRGTSLAVKAGERVAIIAPTARARAPWSI
jgi:branched-chain amino acid transport system ATP-binding protein